MHLLVYLLLLSGNEDVLIEIDNVTFPLSVELRCFGLLILDDDILEGEESVEIMINSR